MWVYLSSKGSPWHSRRDHISPQDPPQFSSCPRCMTLLWSGVLELGPTEPTGHSRILIWALGLQETISPATVISLGCFAPKEIFLPSPTATRIFQLMTPSFRIRESLWHSIELKHIIADILKTLTYGNGNVIWFYLTEQKECGNETAPGTNTSAAIS